MNPSTTPRFEEREAVRIAQENFGIAANATPLPSERDQNFLLVTPQREKFVLKIAKSDELAEVLDLQNEALRRVAMRAPALAVPRVLPTVSGAELLQLRDQSGQAHYVRVIAWLEGRMLADTSPHDLPLLASLGTTMAELDAALQGFTHAAMHRKLHWDIRHAELALEHLALLGSDQQREVRAAMQLWTDIRWAELRHGVIHGDANDHNVLVRDGRVVGLIDFGDLVHSAIASDLAIAMTYAMLDKPQPVTTGAEILRAYHARFPLEVPEVEALFALISARLCMSICYAAYNERVKSGDAYQQVTAAPAWRLLQELMKLSPARVAAAWQQVWATG